MTTPGDDARAPATGGPDGQRTDRNEAVQAELEALRRQVEEMTARFAELQRTAAAAAPAAAGHPDAEGTDDGTARPAPAAPLPDEIVAAIAAAVGAYLGERVRVRQIRLIGSPAWAQQGRVSIQASHRLDR